MNFIDNKLQVFVLGAGFSRSFCTSISLMSDLTFLLFDDKTREDIRYADLSKYVRDVYDKSNKYEDIKNIGTIATVILTKKIFINEPEKMKFDNLKHQLLRFINDKLCQAKADKDKEDTIKQFISNDPSFYCSSSNPPRLGRGVKRIFISLNYDLIIERLGIKVDYGVIDGYQRTIPFKQYLHGEKVIEYVKLHGSLNWFRAKGTDNSNISNIYVVNKCDSHFAIHSEDVPVFIPMAHSKDSFLTGSLFSTLWAKAIDILNKADDILFIGYGFPL